MVKQYRSQQHNNNNNTTTTTTLLSHVHQCQVQPVTSCSHDTGMSNPLLQGLAPHDMATLAPALGFSWAC